MSIEDDIAFLERVPLLRHLGTGALRILAIGAESYTVKADQILFAEGEAADCAYIVQHGTFGLRAARQDGEETIAGPCTLLGETALLAETIRPTTATAREDAVVMRLSRAMFVKMLESYPDAARRLRGLIAARAEQWAHDLHEIGAKLDRGGDPKLS